MWAKVTAKGVNGLSPGGIVTPETILRLDKRSRSHFKI